MSQETPQWYFHRLPRRSQRTEFSHVCASRIASRLTVGDEHMSQYKCPMAAERFSNDVLHMFYGPINKESLPLEPARIYFWLARTEFGEWLHVWKMGATKPDNEDLFHFEENKKQKKVCGCCQTRTRLQQNSVSLAWRLDQEMRRRLILHKTELNR